MNKQFAGAVKQQGGFGLLEFLMVIGLVGVMAVVGLNYYTKARADSNVQRINTDLMALTAAVRDFHGHRPMYGTSSTEIVTGLIQTKKVVESMIGGTQAAPVLVNQYGQPITITGDNTVFEIAYEGVPAAECQGVVMAVSTNFQMIGVGGGSKDNAKADAGSSVVPTTLAGLCENGPHTIIFTAT